MRTYNIQNESFIVSYYFHNFDSINVFLTNYFQDQKLKEITKTLQFLKDQNLKFNIETVNTLIERNKDLESLSFHVWHLN